MRNDSVIPEVVFEEGPADDGVTRDVEDGMYVTVTVTENGTETIGLGVHRILKRGGVGPGVRQVDMEADAIYGPTVPHNDPQALGKTGVHLSPGTLTKTSLVAIYARYHLEENQPPLLQALNQYSLC